MILSSACCTLSPEAARVFHRAHYVSLPHLAARRLTGRWVPIPSLADNAFWVRRYLRFVWQTVKFTIVVLALILVMFVVERLLGPVIVPML